LRSCCVRVVLQDVLRDQAERITVRQVTIGGQIVDVVNLAAESLLVVFGDPLRRLQFIKLLFPAHFHEEAQVVVSAGEGGADFALPFNRDFERRAAGDGGMAAGQLDGADDGPELQLVADELHRLGARKPRHSR